MSEILLWVHPLMQVCAAVLGVWAMWQGLKRVAMLLGKKTLFPWKQHVKLGTLALVLWILGAIGFYVTLDLFGSTHITGLHAELAWERGKDGLFPVPSLFWQAGASGEEPDNRAALKSKDSRAARL